MRYWEIDFVRGIAVILMIAYHFIFDIYLKTFQLHWLAVPIASLFILVSGISLSISYSKSSKSLKFTRRGIKLLALGFFITAISFLLLKEGFIIFGVLHFFGLSSFLVYPFLKYLRNNALYLLFGIIVITTGICLLNFRFNFYQLLWLGFIPNNFYSFDYFPLFPWFGVLLIGIFLGRTFYPNGKRNFKIPTIEGKIINLLTFFGKNSLTIYFVHQPIIISILFLLGYTGFLPMFKI